MDYVYVKKCIYIAICLELVHVSKYEEFTQNRACDGFNSVAKQSQNVDTYTRTHSSIYKYSYTKKRRKLNAK